MLSLLFRPGAQQGEHVPQAKALGAHQHFIQSFKNAKFRPNYA